MGQIPRSPERISSFLLKLVCLVYIIFVHSLFDCLANKNYYNGTRHCRDSIADISNTVAQ